MLLLLLPEAEETLLLLLLDLVGRGETDIDVERDRWERGGDGERRRMDLTRTEERREGQPWSSRVVTRRLNELTETLSEPKAFSSGPKTSMLLVQSFC